MTTQMLPDASAPKAALPFGDAARSRKNVGSLDRAASVGGGALLIARGVRHGGVSGVISAVLGAMMVRRGYTGHCSVYEKLGLHTSHGRGQVAPEEFNRRSMHVSRAFLINKPAAELFAFWRNFENLPRFMTYLREVKSLDDKRSRWKANAPAGQSIEWEAEIIEEEPNKLIAWKSVEGADIHHAGSIRFNETPDRGTEVRVVLDYIPPLGKLGVVATRIFGGDPGQQIQEDLRRFKQLMESGETATNAGPRGKCRKVRRAKGKKS